MPKIKSEAKIGVGGGGKERCENESNSVSDAKYLFFNLFL